MEIVLCPFNGQTYGIHIRRTDNPISINSSPAELFESEIENIINQNRDALFFVASDSDLEQNRLLSKIGDTIITSFFETKRQSTGEMKNEVI